MKKYVLAFAVFAAVTAAIYAGALNYPFLFDDRHVIATNQRIMRPSGLYSFFAEPGYAWEKKTQAGFYRPVLYSAYTLNHLLFGPSPASFKSVNMLLHALNSFLVCLLGMRLARLAWPENTGAAFAPALAASLFFCLHPVMADSVVFITARSVMLLTAFCLSSLLLYLDYEETGARKWLALSALLYALALLTKESAVPFLGVFLLVRLSFYNSRDARGFSLRPLLPHAVFALLFVASRIYYLMFLSPMKQSLGWETHWMTQLAALPRYLGLAVFPFGLSVDHYVPPPTSLIDPWPLAGMLMLLAFAFAFVKCLKKTPLVSALLAWPLLVMLPEMVVPLKDPIVEYRLYLPLAGASVLAAVLASRLRGAFARSVRPGMAALAVLLALFGILAFERTKVWASNYSLWHDAMLKSPLLARPHINVGIELAKAGNFAEARRHLEEAARLEPDVHEEAYINLGNVYAETGELARAAEMQRRALRLNPRSMDAYTNLALVYLNMEDYESAFRTYVKVAEVMPEERAILLLAADYFRMRGQEGYAGKLSRLYYEKNS
ncbi:MAG TPA: tetratricopeptide repeat protein [Nitrospirota bacterium]|nr:tetratricopeptide repeat protein [Nitrospirota bacterium]